MDIVDITRKASKDIEGELRGLIGTPYAEGKALARKALQDLEMAVDLLEIGHHSKGRI